MSTTAHDHGGSPQSPLRAADSDSCEDEPATPTNSGANPPTPLSLMAHPSSGAADAAPSPPAPYNLASGTAEPAALTNFLRYGSVRPPLSVLQEEFLEKYRLWKEHAEPLEGLERRQVNRADVDAITGGSVEDAIASGSEARAGHLANIQRMHARYHGPLESMPGQYFGSGGDAFECKDEEKSDDDGDEGCCNIDHRATASANETDNEKRQLERLAGLIFRPGARLSGTMEMNKDRKTKGCHYEMVVMEADAPDELGRPRGVLARHKCLGDEQCVYVKLSYVLVPDGSSEEGKMGETDEQEDGDQEEEKESIKDEEGASNDGSGGSSWEGGSNEEPGRKEKLTLHIEYSDGDSLIQGIWDHDTLSFRGTDKKLTEAQGDANQMGGTIISGLISGHSSFADGGGGNDDDNQHHTRRHSFLRSPPPANDGTRTFSLSPCTHVHPRGIANSPPWLALSETLTRVGQLTLHGTYSLGNLGLVDTPSRGSTWVVTPERRKLLLKELASHDNSKVVLHRARTDALRRETLAKLVELGTMVDFAELARKRNVEQRREKWRKRVRRCTPRMPQRLRKKKTSTTADDLSKEKKKVQFHDQLAAISWGDLLEEASVQAERTCAIFRRQTALLDALTFRNDDFKAQIMADLRAGGLSLADSHREWDRCIQMGRTVALGWSWFERGSWSCFERSAVVGKRCVYLLFQMHSRLETNHKGLEKAYRGADGRLTITQLDRIRNGAFAVKRAEDGVEGDSDESSDGLCGICQCEMAEDGGANEDEENNPTVCLPCTHRFHWDCIREWLHSHSQCPICRVYVNESE
ncbi:hypothetical protein ACHAXT_000746 [Thalassiosira profunda]